MIEFVKEEEWILAQGLVIHPGVRDVEIKDRSNDVKDADDADGHFPHRINACFDDREVKTQQGLGNIRLDEQATDQNTENDGTDGQPLNPAIGDDQLTRR